MFFCVLLKYAQLAMFLCVELNMVFIRDAEKILDDI